MKALQIFVALCVLFGAAMSESPPQFIWNMDQYIKIGGNQYTITMFVGKSEDNFKKYLQVSQALQGYDEIIMTAIDYEKTDRSFIEALGLKDPTDGYY